MVAERDSTRVHLLGRGLRRSPSSGWQSWPATWRGGLLLVVVCLLVLIPGLWHLPPFDRDEPRFAQASRQMLDTGNWVVPFVQDRPRLNKPPLIYWLQASFVYGATGGDTSKDAIWMYRVPGMYCTLIAVLLTWRLGLRLMDARAAWLGACLLAICPLVVIDAHQARSDQLLLASVVACQWALWRVLSPRGRGTRTPWLDLLVLGTFLGLSILAKGPIGPLVAGLTALAFALAKRSLSLRGVALSFACAAIAAAIVAPWVVLVTQQVGFDKYVAIVWDETIGRSASPKEGHALFPGVHTIALVGLFFPGSILTGLAIVRAVREGFARGSRLRWTGSDATLFLLCWALPSWLVFEAISTRLVHYVMPIYPALALLSARLILRASAGRLPALRDRTTRVGLILWALVGAILTGLGPLAMSVLARRWGVQDHNAAFALGLLVGVVGVLLCAFAGWFALRGRVLRATLLGALAMVLGLGTLLGVVLPANAFLWPARNAIAAVRSLDPTLSRPLAAIGFHEDSQLFLSHGKLVRLSDQDALTWAHAHPAALIVARRVPQDALAHQASLTTNPAHQLMQSGWEVRASARGFNLNRGKWEDLVVLALPDSQGPLPTGGSP